MGLKLSKLVAKTATVSHDFGDGDELTVTYRPHSISLGEIEDAIEQAGQEEDTNAATQIAETVCKVVVSWDLVDEDDRVIPVDVQALREVPASVLGAVLGAIRKDQAVDPEASASSAAG